MRKLGSILCVWVISVGAAAQSAYFQRVIFDNSLTNDQNFYSAASASNTSTLKAVGWR